MNRPSKIVGLLAGWGSYPLVVADHLAAQGCRVIGVGLAGHTDPRLQQVCQAYRTVGLAQLGTAVRFLRRHDVDLATMAGKIHKVRLFARRAWIDLLPDWYGFTTFYPHFVSKTRDRKDDTLLSTVVQAFAAKGIRMAPATDLVPGLLIPPGSFTGGKISADERKDIAFGWHLAREMGRLDIGQSVAVKGRAVLAVEAVEGTDDCIRRAGQLCPAGGFIVVKVAKPAQDMRFDVPTVGMGTIRTLHQAGGRLLAVETERTILLDRAEVLAYARRHGVRLVALREDEALRGLASAA